MNSDNTGYAKTGKNVFLMILPFFSVFRRAAPVILRINLSDTLPQT